MKYHKILVKVPTDEYYKLLARKKDRTWYEFLVAPKLGGEPIGTLKKEKAKCAKCGETDSRTLEWHHTEEGGKKVLCACCHRIVHYEQRRR